MTRTRIKELSKRHLARLKWWPVVAVLYFLTGKLGLLLALPPGYATPVWPPSGIALGLLLVFGWEAWPGVAIGSYLVHATPQWSFEPTFVPVCIAFGAAAAALAGYFITRRFIGFPVKLESEREVLRFFGISAPLACVVSMVVGVSALISFRVIEPQEVPANALTWWLGEALGVMTFTPIVLLFMGRPRALWRGRRTAVGLPLMLGFSVAVSLYVYATLKEQRQIRTELRQDARFLTERFAESTSQTLALFYALDGYQAGTAAIERAGFEAFSKRLLAVNKVISSLAWVPAVRAADVPAFAERARKEGLGDFKIHARDGYGKPTEASVSAWYYPTFYSARQETGGISGFGHDLGSSTVLLAMLEKARDTGMPSMTGRVPVAFGKGFVDGLVLGHPIYRGGEAPSSAEERRAAHEGFYTAVFRIDELIARLRVDAKEHGLEIEIRDESAAIADRPIFSSMPESKLATERRDVVAGTASDRSVVHVSAQARIVDHAWQIRYLRSKKWLAENRSVETWLLLSFGLVVCTILSGFLMILTGRTYRTERLVEERTRDLTRMNAHNAAILSVLPDSTLRVGRDGQFREVLSRVGTIIVDVEHLTGKNVREVFPDLAEPLLDAVETVIDTGEIQVIEMQTRKGDEWLTWEIRLVKCGADEVLSLTRDITVAKTIHEAMAAARDEAIRANRARGDFVANMSHEIRTPMNGILGMATLLGETQLTSEQIDLVNTIQDSGKSLLSLINDVLDFSKLEHRKTELESRPFSLRKCVVSVVQMFRLETDAKALAIELNFGDDVPEAIKGDELRLRQILVNLIGNAVKFTPRGRVSVTASAQPRPSDPSHFDLRMSVEDSGIGIPPEKLHRLFKAFSQADASTTREHGGTGLGLAISRSLVELMGGRIEVTSEAGRGSVFSFEIPVEPVHGTKIDLDRDLRVLSRETLAAMRVLIAEDNLTNQKLMKRLLAKYGVRVTVVGNGQEAVDAVVKDGSDLVLMDLHMPVLDGFDAVAAINGALPIETRPMVVILSADVLPESRSRCEELGISGFLTKPIRVDALEDVLRRAATVMTGFASQPASGAPEAPPPARQDGDASFDADGLLAIFTGDEEILRDALETFLTTAEPALAAIGAAIGSGDSKALEQAAHSFKGAVANFRAPQVAALAQELEARGRAAKLDDAAEKFAVLEMRARVLFDELAIFATTRLAS